MSKQQKRVVKQEERVEVKAVEAQEAAQEQTTQEVQEAKAEVKQEPKEEVKAKPVNQETQLDRDKNAFRIFVENAKTNGTAGERMVIDTIETYIASMSQMVPMTMDNIVKNQLKLYTMFKNIGRREDDFKKTVVMARAFFKEHANGVFHDTRINRGHEVLPLSQDDLRAFFAYLQLYKILADVKDFSEVKKMMAVNRSLDNPAIPAQTMERYIELFS